MSLASRVKVTRVMNSKAVGTSSVNADVILDMQGWDGVQFVAMAGAITDGNFQIKAQQGQASDGTDAADLAGTLTTSLATTDDNKCASLDLFRVQERYVRAVVVRSGSTGAVIDGVIAIQYAGRKAPSTNDATIVQTKSVVSPAEGTA